MTLLGVKGGEVSQVEKEEDLGGMDRVPRRPEFLRRLAYASAHRIRGRCRGGCSPLL